MKQGTTFDVVKETTANGGDKWTRYAVSFTTNSTQTALALALRNPRSTTGTGNALAISSISFRTDNPGAVNSRYSCDGQFYQIRQVVTTTAPITNSTRLFDVDRTTGNAYVTNEKKDLGATINGLGYRPGDGLQYALTYVSNEVASNTAGADRINEYTDPMELYVIDKNGDIKSLGIVGNLPGDQWAGGVIDRAGNYYVVSQRFDTPRFYRIDLNAPTLTATQITFTGAPAAGTGFALYDIAFNPRDNNFYGVSFLNEAYKLVVNNTTNTAAVTRLTNATAVTFNQTQAMGTCFFDIAGTFYAYRNGTAGTAGSSNFYIISTTDGSATNLSAVDPAINSDGASCVTPDQSVDVVKEVVSVTPSGTPNQFNVAFSIKVRNNGSITDPNVQVSDLLWSGNTTANAATTFSGANNVTISGLTVTNTAGATLAANTGATGFNGQSGRAGLLTGNQQLAAGQGAIITFTAQVTFPSAAAVPTAGQNNTAYGTSTVASFIGYTLQGSTLVPPPDLLAQDASTNSAALPETPNADAASPSPIYYQTAILGNVFEDANYGGGAGRSQTASNGEGVSGARVELYSSAGSFIGFANADAAGNYSFVNGLNGITLTASTVYRVRVVNSTVVSNRPGSIAGLLPVQTYLNGNVNRVGGEEPNLIDEVANTGAQTLVQVEAVSAAGTIETLTPLTGTGSVTTPASGPLVGVDFGFNFSTVVNTNNSGQGSLRQFIVNSNTLTNANLDQAAFNGTAAATTTAIDPAAGVEYAIFMLNDGRLTGAPAGLRDAMTAPAGYNITSKAFTFNSATLPTITDSNTAIDGKLQTILTGEGTIPTANNTAGEIILDFVGATRGGLLITGANTRIASLNVTNAGVAVGSRALNTTGAVQSDGAAIVFTGAGTIGSVVNNITGQNNTIATVLLEGGATGVTISNSVMRTGRATAASGTTIAYDGAGILLSNASGNTINNNNISANNGFGIELAGGSNGNTITGNQIGSNGAGTATASDAGISITLGNNNLIGNNTITGNSGDGIVAANSTSGNRFTQNSFSANGDLGIDLVTTGSASVTGDGQNLNDNTDVDTGANGILNFPVITQLFKDANSLLMLGYAPANAVVEFFVADVAAAAYGEGLTYLTTRIEGNATDDTDNNVGTYSFSGFPGEINQGSERNARRFAFTIPLSSLTPAQLTALNTSGARLTATATIINTVNGLSVGNTSEFSGNVAVTATPLPVELKAFEVAASNANALLTWSTASEQNNDHFVVERSVDGGSFERIGQVQGRGTTSQMTNYSFTDINIGTKRAGVVYYRLQQVDTDGTASYSPVRTVNFAAGLTAGVATVGVYPNPATSQDRTITLALTTLPTGTYKVTVLDATGRVVRTQAVQGGQDQTLQVQQLPAGMYLVQVRGNSLNLTQRFSKQ
ncbi:hypothetical protein N008_09270 [Hymenobacter sp. APR13]|nr:hypothetical protein N008_09270 [Hymenobacter sp. APR13]